MGSSTTHASTVTSFQVLPIANKLEFPEHSPSSWGLHPCSLQNPLSTTPLPIPLKSGSENTIPNLGPARYPKSPSVSLSAFFF